MVSSAKKTLLNSTATVLEKLLVQVTKDDHGEIDRKSLATIEAEIHNLLQNVPAMDVDDIRNRAMLAAALEKACRQIGGSRDPDPDKK